MTQVVVQEELELDCIVEIVQSKLVSNFTRLAKRFKETDHQLKLQRESNQRSSLKIEGIIGKLEKELGQQEKSHQKEIHILTGRLERMEERQRTAAQESKEIPVGLRRLNDELYNTQLQFEQKMKARDLEYQELVKHIRTLALQQNRLNDQVNTKENKVEAQKLGKETEVLKDKNHHIEGELKLANHKIEKMEILNEKAERQQAKKQLEIMREIQERVKKEIRNINATSSTNIRPSNSYTTIHNIQNIPNNPKSNIEMGVNGQTHSFSFDTPEESVKVTARRVPSLLDEEQIMQLGDNSRKEELQRIIERWSQKIKYFQIQFKEINENLKMLNRSNSHHKKTQTNKENNAATEAFKDRLNEIKPEIVKLWAKLDTIEDRLSFSERKTEQKLKGINELATLVKENNVSRLDEKLKVLQTELFANLKEVRAKVDSKVGQADYDKYKQQMQEKIGQMNDLIYLKSDKLEVKKALLFLQSKIKQIILVISEDQQNQKDALLTKKQLKCISCDKEVDKFSGIVSSPKGNWDSLPFKDHPPQILGRFGMTNFGSLAKKIKKLESKDLPLLNKRSSNHSFQNCP